MGGGKAAFIGNHGTVWVPVDWNVSFLFLNVSIFSLILIMLHQTWENYNVESVLPGEEYTSYK